MVTGTKLYLGLVLVSEQVVDAAAPFSSKKHRPLFLAFSAVASHQIMAVRYQDPVVLRFM